MQLLAVIQDIPVSRKILGSVSELTETPTLSPARGAWDWDCYSQDMPIDDRDGLAVSDYEFNQSVSC